MNDKAQTQHEFDVIVVGSGAGALTAAITAADQGMSVLVLEKSNLYGGTSAISGGGVWIPNNHYFAAIGGRDSYDEALTYLRNATGGGVAETRIRAYLDQAPKMIEYLANRTRVRYAVAEKYPDYYPHLPGSLAGGRSLDPEPFDTSLLGDEQRYLRPAAPSNLLLGRISWTARDAHKAVAKPFGWQLMILRLILRYKLDFSWRRKTKLDRYAALGGALIASLRYSMMDRGIPLWRNTDFRELIVVDGCVCGVRAHREGRDVVLRATRGVILGSGGFEHNQALRDKYLPKPTNAAWSATPPGNNTGAALLAGMKVGAATDMLDRAWWAPTIRVPSEEKPRGLFAERGFPGAIVVNGKGRRFVNEASPYLEFVAAMYRDQKTSQDSSIPAWVVFDSQFRQHYAMGPLMPAQMTPDRKLKKDWLNTVYWKADTLPELARQIGVDSEGLVDEVRKNNEYARTGVDADFNRGASLFDRYYTAPNVKPNPCLAPIAKGPFYAMRIDAGDIGTKGGLLTNEHAQVLREDDTPIPGLYAIGNCSSAVMGLGYPGAGATLGPAMTFGYIAANHIASTHAERSHD